MSRLENLKIKGELRSYQKKGISVILRRFGGKALCADDMGLGKTFMSIVIIQRTANRALIVCPSFLKYNWRNEFKKFLPGAKVYICSGRTPLNPGELKKYDVLICNYQIVQYWRDAFIAAEVDTLIADEGHYLKNAKAKRSKAVYAIAQKCERRILLTGTPIENQPAELWYQLQIIDKTLFPSWLLFIKRYNGARKSRWGWELKKATNTKELHIELLSKCMIRRKKTEVLKELPPKTRQVIPLEIDNMDEYRAAEADIVAWIKKNTKLNIEKTKKSIAMAKMEKLKLIAARGKIEAIIEWINTTSPKNKMVVFCHHREILQVLKSRLTDCIGIDSGMAAEQRQIAADIFQSDESVRVFLATLRTGGEGLNLFAGSITVHTQFDWNPKKHEQGEDRILRPGQKANNVYAIYFPAINTVEEKIIKLLDLKTQNSDSVIDGKAANESEMLSELIKEMLK